MEESRIEMIQSAEFLLSLFFSNVADRQLMQELRSLGPPGGSPTQAKYRMATIKGSE